ncbi:MAG TPA: hypothetical protein VF442_10565 [Sphingobium sp.]
MNLSTSQLTKIGIALGACYALYRFVDKPAVQTAAIAVAAVIVGRQVPYIGDALSV